MNDKPIEKLLEDIISSLTIEKQTNTPVLKLELFEKPSKSKNKVIQIGDGMRLEFYRFRNHIKRKDAVLPVTLRPVASQKQFQVHYKFSVWLVYTGSNVRKLRIRVVNATRVSCAWF